MRLDSSGQRLDGQRAPALPTTLTSAPASARDTFVRQVPQAVRAMRPTQWTKNGLVVLAAIFAGRITDGATLVRVAVAFVAFSLAASAIYIINDIADRERDRLHPRKRLRPLASGNLSLAGGITTALLCALGALLATALLVTRLLAGVADPFAMWGGSGVLFAVALVSYAGLNVAYSYWLKHQVIWDVLTIAAGFVLRALAGAFAAAIPVSPWFYLCVTFLALLLALGKRRAELLALDTLASAHRGNLAQYTVALLDQLMAIMVTCVLMTYSLYTFESETSNHTLMVTIPLVIFGVFRYLYLVYVRNEGDQPDEMLWRDKQILAAVAACLGVAILVLYGLPLAHR